MVMMGFAIKALFRDGVTEIVGGCLCGRGKRNFLLALQGVDRNFRDRPSRTLGERWAKAALCLGPCETFKR
jgi:hypothetical protein